MVIIYLAFFMGLKSLTISSIEIERKILVPLIPHFEIEKFFSPQKNRRIFVKSQGSISFFTHP